SAWCRPKPAESVRDSGRLFSASRLARPARIRSPCWRRSERGARRHPKSYPSRTQVVPKQYPSSTPKPTMNIIARDVPPRAAWALEQAGVHPLLARLFAARGVRTLDELDDSPGKLLPPTDLLGAREAGLLLADAIAQGQRICIVADYDCDGATACAVALRGLRMLGARPDQLAYVVPDRALHGYGLTPPIVELVQAKGAQVLVTVDNGMASHEAVNKARAAGLKVIITDHHLPEILAEDRKSTRLNSSHVKS